MKILDLGYKFLNEAKRIAQKTKAEYKENIAPKVSEFIDEAIEYTKENYPKVKEKAKSVYKKLKNESNETIGVCSDTFKQYMMKKPKAFELQEQLSVAKRKYNEQAVAIYEMKLIYPDSSPIVREAVDVLHKLKKDVDVAQDTLNKFLQKESSVQQTFKNLNDVNK